VFYCAGLTADFRKTTVCHCRSPCPFFAADSAASAV
jgi:hypothetical protein